jgi:hypothetical protein
MLWPWLNLLVLDVEFGIDDLQAKFLLPNLNLLSFTSIGLLIYLQFVK